MQVRFRRTTPVWLMMMTGMIYFEQVYGLETALLSFNSSHLLIWNAPLAGPSIWVHTKKQGNVSARSLPRLFSTFRFIFIDLLELLLSRLSVRMSRGALAN